ncbi:MAG TPA: hypothetical protein VMQ52_03495 [Candidatus Saccharimonadales bacterium]|jgi:hypothetical protein|nr:hypothetical protein [Candidatus Saccharimonadales bacterium]
MVKKTPNKTVWYKRTVYIAAIGVVSLAIAYLLVSRAIDTGSWWEYFGAVIFLSVALNQFLNSIKLKRKRE